LLPWGHAVGAPDFVALVLVFWGIHQPRKVGIGIAFFMGLLMDVHEATLLGENALAYTLLSYLAIMIHRRILWFPILSQAIHVFPLLLLTQAIQAVVRYAVSGKFPGWVHFVDSVVAIVLWPLITWLLLAPQRRAVDRDHNRPI
jgi:rod shape-determining protein MreD